MSLAYNSPCKVMYSQCTRGITRGIKRHGNLTWSFRIWSSWQNKLFYPHALIRLQVDMIHRIEQGSNKARWKNKYIHVMASLRCSSRKEKGHNNKLGSWNGRATTCQGNQHFHNKHNSEGPIQRKSDGIFQMSSLSHKNGGCGEIEGW
jgi:hypothetical protein